MFYGALITTIIALTNGKEFDIDGTIVVGTLFVLAGNLFVLYTRDPAAKKQVRAPAVDSQHLMASDAKS